MGRNSTSAAGVFTNVHYDCAIAIPPAEFDSTTKIDHFYINPGPISCFYDDKNSDVFLLYAEHKGAYTVFPALRVYNAADARTRFLILTRDHPACETLAEVAVKKLLPYEYRNTSTVCIPPSGYAPFLFFYFHGNSRKRNGTPMPDMYLTGKYPELLRNMNLEGAATYPMQSNAPQKTNDPLCADGRWDEFIARTIRAFEAAPASMVGGRAPKRARVADVPRASKRAAAPAIVFDEGCTLASVFEKLDAAARAAAAEPVDLPAPGEPDGAAAAESEPSEPGETVEYMLFGDLEPSEADEAVPEYPEFGEEQSLDAIFAQIAASCADPSDDDPVRWDLAVDDAVAGADDAAIVVDVAFHDEGAWMMDDLFSQ